MGARGRAELRAKGVIEVGHVAETARDRDVDYARVLRREPHGGSSEPRAQHVAVRREARGARERAQEMKSAQSSLARERVEVERLTRVALDEPHGAHDAAL